MNNQKIESETAQKRGQKATLTLNAIVNKSIHFNK